MLESTTAFKTVANKFQPVALNLLVDWIEASLLFGRDTRLSFPDVVEFLVSEELCETQADAWAVIDDLKRALRRRKRHLGTGYPVRIEEMAVVRLAPWRDTPAYAFCLYLSLHKLYPKILKENGPDFTEQGELFELLVFRSLECILKGWVVYRTGWSRANANTIVGVVRDVAAMLGEPQGDLERWVRSTAKEAGLDILCFREFSDGRGGIPIYLFQCASGKNWESKLTTPDINLWSNLIQFTAKPRRGFATPLSIVDEEFSIHAGRVQGMFLDRCRILEPLRSSRPWLPQDFRRRLNRWTRPKLKVLSWQ